MQTITPERGPCLRLVTARVRAVITKMTAAVTTSPAAPSPPLPLSPLPVSCSARLIIQLGPWLKSQVLGKSGVGPSTLDTSASQTSACWALAAPETGMGTEWHCSADYTVLELVIVKDQRRENQSPGESCGETQKSRHASPAYPTTKETKNAVRDASNTKSVCLKANRPK